MEDLPPPYTDKASPQPPPYNPQADVPGFAAPAPPVGFEGAPPPVSVTNLAAPSVVTSPAAPIVVTAQTAPTVVTTPTGPVALGPQPQPTQVVVVQGNFNCPICKMGVVREEFTLCGLCLAIFCFPFGLICCLFMRARRCSNCRAIVN